MKNHIILPIILLIQLNANGQNLVQNHSFEDYDKCPTGYTENAHGNLIQQWNMPTYGTPDFYHSCSRFNVGVPSNMMGNLFPADGKAYVGLILLQDPERSGQGNKPLNYREYLQTELAMPLIKDSLYLVKLWYAPADHTTYLVSGLGILLSTDPVHRRKGVLEFDPQVQTDSSSLSNTVGYWSLLSDTIISRGEERYLTIGNFMTDDKTAYSENDLSKLSSSTRRIVQENNLAYYYIDAIEIIPLSQPASGR